MLRQLLWDYVYIIFNEFYKLHKENVGFDVQIGHGDVIEFHHVHVVLTNLLGDHPQMHDLAGISRSACRFCHCSNFETIPILSIEEDDGTYEADILTPRCVRTQFEVSKCSAKQYQKFVCKEGNCRLKTITAERREAEVI